MREDDVRKSLLAVTTHDVTTPEPRQVLSVRDVLASALGNSQQDSSLASVSSLTGSGGQQSEAGRELSDTLVQINNQLTQLRPLQQTHVDTLIENTRAVLENSVAKTSGGSSTVSTVAKLFENVFGGALGGVAPIVSGLVSLFGGGKSDPVAPVVPFTLPSKLKVDGGITDSGGSGISAVDRDQDGRARSIAPAPAAPTQITVQVNAIDSQSFMDHSQDIARAVREAMLNSHPLNDTVMEL